MRILAPLLLVAGCSAVFGLQSSAEKSPVVTVNGPTIAAFYAYDQPGKGSGAESDESLADFQFYAGKIKESLSKRGIRFQEIYSLSFGIRVGTQTTIVTADNFKGGVGYYLIAPGVKPRIEQGVLTDADLLEVADRYFSHSAK